MPDASVINIQLIGEKCICAYFRDGNTWLNCSCSPLLHSPQEQRQKQRDAAISFSCCKVFCLLSEITHRIVVYPPRLLLSLENYLNRTEPKFFVRFIG